MIASVIFIFKKETKIDILLWKKKKIVLHVSIYRRNPRTDPRKLVTYRDLDAPDDMDVF